MAVRHHVLLVREAANGRFAHQKDMDAKRRAEEPQSRRRRRNEVKERRSRLTAAWRWGLHFPSLSFRRRNFLFFLTALVFRLSQIRGSNRFNSLWGFLVAEKLTSGGRIPF
jgi:hypothetical protein